MNESTHRHRGIGAEAEREPSFRLTGLQCYLTLPFLHRFSQQELLEGIDGKLGMWSHWFKRLVEPDASTEDLDVAMDYSYFFLPHVRQLLYPEFIGLRSATDVLEVLDLSSAEDKFDSRTVRAAFKIEAYGPMRGPALRLTLQEPSIVGMHFYLRGQPDVTFTIPWVDCVLFPQHVGVLVIKIDVADSLSVARAAEFLRAIRKTRFRRRLTVPVPEVESHEGEQKKSWNALIDGMLEALRSTRVIANTAVEETIGTTFKTLVIAGVEDCRCDASTTDNLERCAFTLATGHGSKSRVDTFTAEGLRRLRARSLQSWANWRVIGYDEGISITMCTEQARHDHGEAHALRDNLLSVRSTAEWAYMLLHVLALAQSVRMHLLYQELSGVSTKLDGALRAIDEVLRSYVKFRRVLWTPEPTSTPAGRQVYDLSWHCFELEALGKWLQDDVEILTSYLHGQRERLEALSSRRTQRALEFLTIVGVPAGLAIALTQGVVWGEIAPPLKHHHVSALIFVIIVAAFFVIVYMAIGLTRRAGLNDEA